MWFERKRAAEDGEGPRVAGEDESTYDVHEAEAPVQPPRTIVLARDLRGGEQHGAFGAVAEQSVQQGPAEAEALDIGSHVQFGEFEIVTEDRIYVVLRPARVPHPGADLLVPPLVGVAAVSVGDADEGSGVLGKCDRDGLPSGAPCMFGPHRCAMLLRPARVSHRSYVDRQQLGQVCPERRGGQVDEDRCAARGFGTTVVARLGGRFVRWVHRGSMLVWDRGPPSLDGLSVGPVIIQYVERMFDTGDPVMFEGSERPRITPGYYRNTGNTTIETTVVGGTTGDRW